jgi:hypothetical protein
LLNIIDNAAVGVQDFVQKRFYLNPCYPNPATRTTTLSFYINSDAAVQLKICDMNGQVVKNVISGRQLSQGEHSVVVDLSDLSPGAYIYTIEAGVLKDGRPLQIVR